MQVPVIHQEANCAQVHAVGWNITAAFQQLMQDLQHVAIAAKDDYGVGVIQRNKIMDRAKLRFGLACLRRR
jgi:hypothetical protein